MLARCRPAHAVTDGQSVDPPVQAALDKGLILDTETQRQLLLDQTYSHMAPVADGLVWPPEPLRSVLICERRSTQTASCPGAQGASAYFGSSDGIMPL